MADVWQELVNAGIELRGLPGINGRTVLEDTSLAPPEEIVALLAAPVGVASGSCRGRRSRNEAQDGKEDSNQEPDRDARHDGHRVASHGRAHSHRTWIRL